MTTTNAPSDTITAIEGCKKLYGPFAEVLKEVEEGDVIGLFCSYTPIASDDGAMYFDGEYYFAAVLFASPAMKVISRFYHGEPEWVEPIPGTKIEPVAGTTILLDDAHITLVDQNGKKIPCATVGRAFILKNRLPKLPEEFFWSVSS